MRVGFVGLGIMGRPMALNLLKSGHEVTVWARRPESMAPLLEAGAHGAANPAAVAAQVDVIFSMVADAPDVREVMLGAQGVVKGAHPGLIAVDMSTIPPAAARSIAADLTEQGITFLDAPVSGGEVGAIAGTLFITAVVIRWLSTRCSRYLRASVRALCISASPARLVAKAANQILTGIGVLAVAEAIAFAKKQRCRPATSARGADGRFCRLKILENHGQRMLDRNFKPGFKSWMHEKI